MEENPLNMKVHELFARELCDNADFRSAIKEACAHRGFSFSLKKKLTPRPEVSDE